MVIVSVYLCLLIVSNHIFQPISLFYQKLAQFASMSDKRAALIVFHRPGWCKNRFFLISGARKFGRPHHQT